MKSETAKSIYEILQQECGASSYWLENFVLVQSSEHCTEYRFCGNLGFGGKFWRNANRWYVNCYPEDETPERNQMIEKANGRLDQLKAETGED